MHIFNGKEASIKIDSQIKSFLKENRVEKKLGIILIGENGPSQKYVSLKEKYCKDLGITCEVLRISYSEAKELDFYTSAVSSFISREDIGGVIIQLPLPSHSLDYLLNLIPEEKDIDVISPELMELFMEGKTERKSPIIRSFEYFCKSEKIQISNMNITLIGNGYLVGKPLSRFISLNGGKVEIIDNYKSGKDISCHLLILSAGFPGLVDGQNLSSKMSVIDFGTTIVDGRLKGDLNLESSLNHLSSISPSPGGVGPLVIRFLVINFIEAVTHRKLEIS